MSSYYRIDLKDVPKRYRNVPLVKVLLSSPLQVKKTVEQYAYYFRREFHYDFVQFQASDCEPYTAYLFASDEGLVWVGACCFRTRLYEDLGISTEALQWIWLHPYVRRKSILKKHWQTLRLNHGDFYVEPPLSPAMREFLLKHAKDSAWYPVYEDKQPDVDEIKAKLMAASAGQGEGGSKS